MEVKQDSLSIEFKVESTLERDEHGNYDYVTPITGTVRGLLDDTLSEREVIAGGIHGYRVHLTEARDQPVSIFDIFDAYGDLEAFFHVLIDDSGTGFRKKALPEEHYPEDLMDILVISDVGLKKYFRRRGLGALMVERFVELFGGGCLFAALDIKPAREREEMDEGFRRDMALHLFEQDPKKAKQKLMAYWEQRYFRHVPGTSVMTMCRAQ